MWLGNSKDNLVFIHHSYTHKKTHRTKKKTDRPGGKPVLCHRAFSSVFYAVFYTVNLHSLTQSVWGPLEGAGLFRGQVVVPTAVHVGRRDGTSAECG